MDRGMAHESWPVQSDSEGYIIISSLATNSQELRGTSMEKIKFAESYIEKLFTEKDSLGLYHLILTAEIDKASPACWTFNRALEWLGSLRSGVWQYYEVTDPSVQERLAAALLKFELNEIAQWYSFGMKNWQDKEEIRKLDDWMFKNEHDIEGQIFGMVAKEIDNIKEVAT